jgi:hypothetical protein
MYCKLKVLWIHPHLLLVSHFVLTFLIWFSSNVGVSAIVNMYKHATLEYIYFLQSILHLYLLFVRLQVMFTFYTTIIHTSYLLDCRAHCQGFTLLTLLQSTYERKFSQKHLIPYLLGQAHGTLGLCSRVSLLILVFYLVIRDFTSLSYNFT